MAVALIAPVAIHRAESTRPREDGYAQLVRRVQSEYLEMPGLCLTVDQGCRLWALDATTCRRILQDLASAGFIAVSERGVYVRRTTV